MATRKKQEDTSFKDFLNALDEIQRTKGIDKEELVEAVEAALLTAFKKDYKGAQNARVEINRQTGQLKVYAQRIVVEELESAANEVQLLEAQKINPLLQIGDVLEEELDPKAFGRVAAQNAKQMILQRIKEAERNLVYKTFSDKKDELVTGVISRIEKSDVYVEIGKHEGMINYANQIPTEQYFQGMRIKVYIVDVQKTPKGPMVTLSRSNPMLIKRLFELEIPEIYDGTIEIASLAREAGSRTKLAVRAHGSDIDPVGACVGHKGVRIQSILNELGNERIDVVEYSEDSVRFIRNALSPAEVRDVFLDEEMRRAIVVVDDSQLSLAIGKDGQNVRLAAKLTGYKIDIKNQRQYSEIMQNMENAPDINVSFPELIEDYDEEVIASIGYEIGIEDVDEIEENEQDLIGAALLSGDPEENSHELEELLEPLETVESEAKAE
ncbi:MAG: transcription termination factor NusA [Eubacteriaceae bacterium]|nr:transcription termination factor NusA [Eubacteriaceae bacterium]